MNFPPIMQQSLSKDFNRLIELCSSYGLNEQQTNQIISDFKNGSFAQQDQSIDDSFQQSLRDMESNQYQEQEQEHQHEHEHGQGQEHEERSQHEEYSFKHHRNGGELVRNRGEDGLGRKKGGLQSDRNVSLHADSFDHESKKNIQNLSNSGVNEDFLEFFINQQKQFERTIQNNLEKQNAYLKEQLKTKDQRIEEFMKAKMQDSEIIKGLKDSVMNLSSLIQEKDQAYRHLLQRYEKLKIQSECVSTQKTSKTQLSHQQSLTSFQQRKSLLRQKQHCITEVQPQKLVKKSSQKYIKQITNPRNPPKLTQKTSQYENRENIQKNDQHSKRSGIDISKYKGMIEKLRSSYQFR